jgi:hypothetical protein
MRTNGLKSQRELRDAALFCVGMTHNLGTDVWLAPVEAQDYDFVARWGIGEVQHFCPVQLKEVVPPHLNSTASIQDVLGKLSRYSNSNDVSFAIKFNQRVHFDPTSVQVPNDLTIGGLWVFGAITEDQSMWGLWGDFLQTGRETIGIRYSYPGAAAIVAP